MSIFRCATFALLGLFFDVQSHAASFDCSRASSKIEKLICSDPALSKLDEDLTAAYAQAQKQMSEPDALRQQQRGWLGNVRNRCGDAKCLIAAYTARIAQLKILPSLPRRNSKKGESEDAESCHMMAEFSNRSRDELNLLLVDFLATERQEKDIRPIFENKADIFGGLSYWSVDLNNDGVLDHLVISVQGTAHVSHVYARSGKKGTNIAEVPGELDDPFLDIDFLAVGGRYYLYSGNIVWRMNELGEFKKVCRFSVREKRFELVKGKQEAVCVAVTKGNIKYIPFSFVHRLRGLPAEDRFWSQSLHDGSMAKADIDNDGALDNIVKIDYIHGAGRGCGATYIAVTNESGNALPDTSLNQLLLSGLDNGRCGPSLDAFFIHGGVTYVDARYSSDDGRSRENNGNIYRIKAARAETICEFQNKVRIESVETE